MTQQMPWQEGFYGTPGWAALAGLGQGLLTAAAPGGNLGQGLMQAQQFMSSHQQQKQLQEMRDLQKQQIEFEMEQARTANQQATEAQQKQQQYLQSLDPGLFSPQQQGMLQAFPDQAPQILGDSLFKPAGEAPKTVGGMQWDGDSFEPIPGYTEQAEAIARAGRAPVQGPQPTERERNALAAGLRPGTPEYAQYILGRDDTQPGPFQGTGLDAQAYNILLTGDPASPEFSAAYAQLAMPKVTFDPVTQKMISVQPDMSWAKKPAQLSTVTPQQPEPQGMSVGQTETTTVPGATIPSNQGAPIFNETQGKAAGFADRMSSANSELEQAAIANAGMNVMEAGKSAVPLIGNFLTSSDRQKFEQAERNFINAQLRRESGAVISPEEFSNARKQYIPQPGDSKEVLAQKKANREQNISAMQRESGPFYKPATAESEIPKKPDGTPDYSKMTDEQLLNFIKKGQ